MARTCLAVVLAAGDATRMKSSKSKVLHMVGNLPLIAHVTRAAASAGVSKVGLVVGRDANRVIEAAGSGIDVPVTSVEQTERKGTGHAVLMARDIIAEGFDDIAVLYWRCAADQSRKLARRNRRTRARRRCRGSWLSRGRSHRLWQADRAQRRADRHPRAQGSLGRRARHRFLQWRRDHILRPGRP